MCIYIFKEQVHCKKLELNLLCQYDTLLAEDILFLDLSYGCYGNKTAASGLFCGAVQEGAVLPRLHLLLPSIPCGLGEH